jgi:fructose-1-phosphate kinase PfkB-like protein
MPTSNPCIITLTGNLLWEKTLSFPDWAPGHTQRASSASFQAGGKGTNVSRALSLFGCPTLAVIFPGGATGADCEAWLRDRSVACRPFQAENETRVGFVVRGGGRPETTFLGPDAAPGAGALRECAHFLDSEPDGGLLAICGSLPGWPDPAFDPLRAALERWLERGTVAVDTYGEPLAWFAARPTPLVKVNRLEFDGLFAPEERSGEVCARLRQLCRSRPVRAWVVTDGPGPVWWVEGKGEPQSLNPPAIREVSATGSGDVLFAALLHALLKLGLPFKESLALAMAHAASHASGTPIAGWQAVEKSRQNR